MEVLHIYNATIQGHTPFFHQKIILLRFDLGFSPGLSLWHWTIAVHIEEQLCGRHEPRFKAASFSSLPSTLLPSHPPILHIQVENYCTCLRLCSLCTMYIVHTPQKASWQRGSSLSKLLPFSFQKAKDGASKDVSSRIASCGGPWRRGGGGG